MTVLPTLLICCTSVVLQVASIAVYLRDSAFLQEHAEQVTQGAQTPSEQMERIVEHVSSLPNVYADDYVLLPIFRFMKPTAAQVIEHGGDCAYKARAAIVLLDKLGVSASKLALYDESGRSVHAVAQVQTERGVYIADMLFGVIYRYPDGTPIALKDIPGQRDIVLDRSLASGNHRVSTYPREKYRFNDVRTINWNKHGATVALYSALSYVFGEEAINAMPRPFIAEEPALMVFALAIGGLLAWGMLGLLLFRVWRRFQKRPNNRFERLNPRVGSLIGLP